MYSRSDLPKRRYESAVVTGGTSGIGAAIVADSALSTGVVLPIDGGYLVTGI
jgi:NADP-dependent 3-hydroxy acid dehydrogenase YdfG